ncbi:hypothetical protein [Candidatus Magnetominusculus xianensis]|uniref:Uncharacterized protein n=1 Tax=Candidatus Magnetominusculus xianensis TaxID=1748249 RepID=A0ABR5SDD7_9BACT|nr:hypothetical protein [Candidatus Magnetominusculus xianensis]KWT82928.1 hypothetical protein ASN18_2289 [Candidatus Magnetominusculus xianensis]MBF0403007.1 hypothetical protein [Nitrospirota bacterium]
MSCFIYGNIAPPPVMHVNLAEEKILRYSQYPKGWCYGQGVPPSYKVVKQAIELLHTAQTYFFFTASTIGADGEIQLIVYHDNDRLQFSITENKGIEFEHERKVELSRPFLPEYETEEICYEESITFDDAITKINHFGREIWSTHTSTLSNKSGLYRVLMEEGSVVTHSRILQTGQVYPAYPLAV